MNRFGCSLLVSLLWLCVSPCFVRAMDIAIDRQARTIIVIPDNALPVVREAADELRHHVLKATGAKLQIVKESERFAQGGGIFLGATRRAGKAGIDPVDLPPNGYTIRSAAGALLIIGDDSDGDVFDHPHVNYTRVGTLFGVYTFLEKELNVCWLWPGALGEVIPTTPNFVAKNWDHTGKPALLHARIRTGYDFLNNTAFWHSPEAKKQFHIDQNKWLRRQRFAQAVSLEYGHGFTNYWDRFGKEHPSYFNLLPNDTRAQDPGSPPWQISMCVAEPGLWKQVVADWRSSRSPERPWINGCENDTTGKCVCDKCVAWDATSPDLPVSRNKARIAFDQGDRGWTKHLGSLSDRYARFWLALQSEGEKEDPNATVVGLAYGNYAKPPVKTKLNKRIVVGIVPAMGFPWTDKKREAARKQWVGWTATGCGLYLRPNYTFEGHNLPVFYARKFGEDFAFAYQRGMIATDFDALTGQWATQGPNLYMIARKNVDPTRPEKEILDEYYQSFGPAAEAVQNYFEHWEEVSDVLTATDRYMKAEQEMRAKGFWSRFYEIAPHLFTPQVMAKGRRHLERAQAAAQGDPINKQRIAFLENGFTDAELTLEVARANEAFRRSGNQSSFTKALTRLDAFRKRIEPDGTANMSYLRWSEDPAWPR